MLRQQSPRIRAYPRHISYLGKRLGNKRRVRGGYELLLMMSGGYRAARSRNQFGSGGWRLLVLLAHLISREWLGGVTCLSIADTKGSWCTYYRPQRATRGLFGGAASRGREALWPLGPPSSLRMDERRAKQKLGKWSTTSPFSGVLMWLPGCLCVPVSVGPSCSATYVPSAE